MILLKKGTVIEYVPVNERDEADPAVVGIKYVPNSKVDSYQAEMTKKTMRTKNQDVLAHIQGDIQRKQFVENVEYIKGFMGEDGVEITSVEDFYDMAPANLIAEIIRAMEDCTKLTEGERKNLSRVSGSPSHQGTRSTAEDATHKKES